MKVKIAIVLEGEPNSGKTSTIKEFISIYSNIAVQPNGRHYYDSCDFLKTKGYYILSYPIENRVGNGD